MTRRTTTTTVTFRRPFILAGFESIRPGGTYTIDTEEELIETVSFPAWRRIATVIHLNDLGTTSYLTIDPVELHEAAMRDGAQIDATASAAPQARPQRGRAALDADRLSRRRF
jgi:hypothetical protein